MLEQKHFPWEKLHISSEDALLLATIDRQVSRCPARLSSLQLHVFLPEEHSEDFWQYPHEQYMSAMFTVMIDFPVSDLGCSHLTWGKLRISLLLNMSSSNHCFSHLKSHVQSIGLWWTNSLRRGKSFLRRFPWNTLTFEKLRFKISNKCSRAKASMGMNSMGFTLRSRCSTPLGKVKALGTVVKLLWLITKAFKFVKLKNDLYWMRLTWL